eukprot:UN28722
MALDQERTKKDELGLVVVNILVNSFLSTPLYKTQFLLQTQPELLIMKRVDKLSNTHSIIRETILRDGFRNLWRGTIMNTIKKYAQVFLAPYILMSLQNVVNDDYQKKTTIRLYSQSIVNNPLFLGCLPQI